LYMLLNTKLTTSVKNISFQPRPIFVSTLSEYKRTVSTTRSVLLIVCVVILSSSCGSSGSSSNDGSPNANNESNQISGTDEDGNNITEENDTNNSSGSEQSTDNAITDNPASGQGFLNGSHVGAVVSGTRNEPDDDNYSYFEFDGVEANQNGEYITLGVTSITDLNNTNYEFLSGVYSYTAPIEVSQPLPDECIVLDGYAGLLITLTARSSRESNDAGDAVVTTDVGTFATVPFENDYYFYFDNNYTANAPNNVVVNYTGNNIDAIEVSVPNVAPLIVLSHADEQTFNEQSVYEWVAGSDSQAYINITGHISDNPPLSYSCLAIDDGEFSLSPDVISRIGGSFETIRGFIYRVKTELSVTNNIAIRSSGISSVNF